jgi:hypothetical protein
MRKKAKVKTRKRFPIPESLIFFIVGMFLGYTMNFETLAASLAMIVVMIVTIYILATRRKTHG